MGIVPKAIPNPSQIQLLSGFKLGSKMTLHGRVPWWFRRKPGGSSRNENWGAGIEYWRNQPLRNELQRQMARR